MKSEVPVPGRLGNFCPRKREFARTTFSARAWFQGVLSQDGHCRSRNTRLRRSNPRNLGTLGNTGPLSLSHIMVSLFLQNVKTKNLLAPCRHSIRGQQRAISFPRSTYAAVLRLDLPTWRQSPAGRGPGGASSPSLAACPPGATSPRSPRCRRRRRCSGNRSPWGGASKPFGP